MVFPVLAIIGIVLFLYLTWRNLRDNYKTENLITYSWLSLSAFLVGGRITYGLSNWGEWQTLTDWVAFYNNSGINLAGGYVVLLMVTMLLAQKYGWKLWPFLEDMINNIMILVMGFWLGRIIFSKAGIEEGVIGLIFIFSLWISGWVKKNYRSFVWYKSGKKGFRFFFTNLIFFLLLSVYFLVIKEKIFFGAFLFTGLINLVGLFILGGVLEPLMVYIKRKRL